MKCLIINLDRSADRLAHMTSQFARIGVAFERVSGLDAAIAGVSATPSLSAAEVCCYLSHRRCWQMIADGTDRYGVVFEDDVVFSANAGLLLSDDGWVPRDADVVKLESFFIKVRLARKHLAVGNGYSVARLVGEHVGAAGYLVSKVAAQKLIRRTGPARHVVDHVLFSPTLLTCSLNTTYQLTPALCAQSQFIVGGEVLPTLIQVDPPHRRKRLIDKIRSEASRGLAHVRNRSFWGTEELPAVAFKAP